MPGSKGPMEKSLKLSELDFLLNWCITRSSNFGTSISESEARNVL